MRITRYVNGKKLENPFENKPYIEKQIVAATIEKVNRRVNNGFEKNGEKTI